MHALSIKPALSLSFFASAGNAFQEGARRLMAGAPEFVQDMLASSRAPDAIQFLKRDHKRLRALMKKLRDTTERSLKTRAALFDRFRYELETHTQVEETVFYQALRRDPETRPEVLEGLEEHRVANRLVEEIGVLPPRSEVWTAKFKVLRENVEHHLDEEERELFREARHELSPAQLRELGARMHERKQALANP